MDIKILAGAAIALGHSNCPSANDARVELFIQSTLHEPQKYRVKLVRSQSCDSCRLEPRLNNVHANLGP